MMYLEVEPLITGISATSQSIFLASSPDLYVGRSARTEISIATCPPWKVGGVLPETMLYLGIHPFCHGLTSCFHAPIAFGEPIAEVLVLRS